jgi:membrane-associated protease RseP (regulator of RpoE activity)
MDPAVWYLAAESREDMGETLGFSHGDPGSTHGIPGAGRQRGTRFRSSPETGRIGPLRRGLCPGPVRWFSRCDLCVVSGSPAAQAGLQSGDVTTGIDGTKIESDSALAQILSREKRGDTVTLTVRRGSQTLTMKVALGQLPS